MKLVLGAAKLGMNYGLFNNKKINQEEFKRIEKLVFKLKINFFINLTLMRFMCF
jgi:hypothetical protein